MDVFTLVNGRKNRLYLKNKFVEEKDFLYAARNSEKLKVAFIIFGWAGWKMGVSFRSWDPKIDIYQEWIDDLSWFFSDVIIFG